VISILLSNGFEYTGTRGSHAQYEKGPLKVTVDTGYAEFSIELTKSMIRQSDLDRVDFYCSTKATAKKINKRFKEKKMKDEL
jgi:predicted RNA binding protein YcfA (HicA-like mRNA interferase family)